MCPNLTSRVHPARVVPSRACLIIFVAHGLCAYGLLVAFFDPLCVAYMQISVVCRCSIFVLLYYILDIYWYGIRQGCQPTPRLYQIDDPLEYMGHIE